MKGISALGIIETLKSLTPTILVIIIIIAAFICVALGIWRTNQDQKELKERRKELKNELEEMRKNELEKELKEKGKNELEWNIYDKIQPFAKNTKIILQMFIGAGLAGLIILKILDHFGIHFDNDFLNNFIYGQQTLLIVSLALAYTAALELAYALFTPGPDEAVEPLITGLAAAILLLISKTNQIDPARAGGIALLVLALVALFTLRYFFILEKGLIHLYQGDSAANKHLPSEQISSSDIQPQESIKDSGTKGASSTLSPP